MNWKSRFHFASRLSLWHLALSIIIASICAALIFFALYPYPYYKITGSISIFLIMIAVDVSCGPLCTLIVASPIKSRRETALDLLIIGLVQLSALLYGMHSLYVARPVYEVYENNKFRIVMANEVQIDEFKDALPEFKKLPLLGIHTIGTRNPKDATDQMEGISMALAGIEIGLRPSWWTPYNDIRPKVKVHYQPISQLTQTLDNKDKKVLKNALTHYKLNEKNTFFLPLDNSKHKNWIVFLNKQADIVGYTPLSKDDTNRK